MVPWAGKRLRIIKLGGSKRLRFMVIGRGCGLVVTGRVVRLKSLKGKVRSGSAKGGIMLRLWLSIHGTGCGVCKTRQLTRRANSGHECT
jgi:hypothetical protein